ncbi:TetR/AcrR family transcriptional regulator [Ruixingdingia sedimenti]|uniref:TetR/AcrR family transcriptional regulator n=1 Tax=Ruixingdingia sedimenti TaxID=3073604 RepID=A0ABU1F879_9RHOB|nr:TetR/AcrR family transcriptional regulator [Xinfangfangia sp. LG-4]MDR5652813.1 TetR/AcrR family transcriptional regulator [Xinfangfangia sp. LG-4]
MATRAPKTKRGTARRETLLRSAERVIGEKGFAAASIADITRDCGAALGTFYIYFTSKEDVFRELVGMMGSLTRRMMTEAVQDAPNRLEAERLGLRAFLAFVAERPSLYRIVEEARFVDPDAYRAYFTGFASAYATHLEKAVAKGDIRPGDAEVRAWALMGMAKSLGDRFVMAAEKPDLDRVTDEAFAMIRDGLAPGGAA